MLGAWRNGSPHETVLLPTETVIDPVVDEVPETETPSDPGMVTVPVHDWPVWQIVVVAIVPGLDTVSISDPHELTDGALAASPEYETCQ
jgi:hypothetical protein